MMSATLAGIRLRDMRIGAETFAAIQTLTTLLALTLTRPHALRAAGERGLRPAPALALRHLRRPADRPRLRRRRPGLRPAALAGAGAAPVVWGGVACDLVVVNHEPASYQMALARQIGSLREAHIAACDAQPCAAETGFFILARERPARRRAATLRALARVRLNADGRPLAHHVQELVERARPRPRGAAGGLDRVAAGRHGRRIAPRSPPGEFAPASGEFRFDVSALVRPTRALDQRARQSAASARRSARPAAATAGP